MLLAEHVMKRYEGQGNNVLPFGTSHVKPGKWKY